MELISILLIIVLVLLSGLFSGLTLGLLGLDKTDLERKIKTGGKDAKAAKKVYSVRKKGNLLLCTLLLGNVLVNSILAVFLGQLSTGVMAVVFSTALIVIFGEILPQATISRYALVVGAKTVWLVKIFRIILFPICVPIAFFLDWMLGNEMPTIWSRRELEEIVKSHGGSKDSDIDADEERIISGALNFSNKKVDEVMTPRSVAFMLEEKEVLDQKLLNKIKKNGFTRVPVYRGEKDKVVGILFVRDLIGLKLEKKVKAVCKKNNFLKVAVEDNLDYVLNRFLTKKIHLASVFDKFNVLQGIISLEDVLEEIIKKEIVDESDVAVDLRRVARKKR